MKAALDKAGITNQDDVLGTQIEKFLDKGINISPFPVGEGGNIMPGLDNHSMGTMFEELVRCFNEDNNEEAGEHRTPRNAVRLMANRTFLPVADRIESGTYLLYDCACGTGGMLTMAEETLQQIATHLYCQEINGETYAICKADPRLKGDGDAADNIFGGPEHSTLSNDAFRSREFDFMPTNPPYGTNWKTDLERIGGKKDLKDPRFVIQHAGDAEYSLLTRSSYGQMLFLANMLSKMKHDAKKCPLGSRIAEVHNGSSLFTGDAGQGESNIRRWIIESDWLEAIVALPLNLFYNTGIATYVWVLSNRKPAHRQGKVQLIETANQLRVALSDGLMEDHNVFLKRVEATLKQLGRKPSAADLKLIINAVSWRVEDAPAVIKKIHKPGKAQPAPLRGRFEAKIDGKTCVVEYEPNSKLRDYEQIPLLEKGGIKDFIRREVLPYTPDA